MQNRIFRSIGALTFVIVCSAVIPSTLLFLQSAVTPHFDPVAFGMPITAVEVVSKRTEKAVTFEISPGKFASVSAGEHLESPSCTRAALSTLCRAITLVRDFVPNAFAVSQGPNSPGTAYNDNTYFSADDFLNPGNVTASDNAYATVTDSATCDGGCSPAYSTALAATNFGFSIPVGATINGVQPSLEASVSQIDTWGVNDIAIIKNGTQNGACSAGLINLTTSDAYYTAGGNSDLCGVSLTPSNVNASNFGWSIYFVTFSPDPVTLNVDHMRITVYYTEAAGAAPFFSWWSFPLMFAGCGWVLWKEGYLGSEPLLQRS